MEGKRLRVEVAKAFRVLLKPARYKGAYGGRGSGKSHFFAEQMVLRALQEPGFRGVCIREVQRSLRDSAKRLVEDKIESLGVGEFFEVLHDRIVTPGGGVIIFQGMRDHTAESIKSLEGFKVAWCEEAQTLSERSLGLLRPTIREAGSELWFSWNPTRKTDPVDVMFRGPNPPSGAVSVFVSWRDNPWFPEVLEQERLDCLRENPEQYDHIWEGGYVSVATGAYFAANLAEARAEGRVGHLGRDPLLPIRLFVDIGGAGARADAFVIWVVQWVGREIRVLDYYEAHGQELGYHLSWLRDRGYDKKNTIVYLPHDGAQMDRVFSVSYESAFKEAGFKVIVVPNQGPGAAKARIEAVRRIFPFCWFDGVKCAAGLDALGWYHEKIDRRRGIGLGPEHDWSSHAADAFGLMAVSYRPPTMEGGLRRFRVAMPRVLDAQMGY